MRSITVEPVRQTVGAPGRAKYKGAARGIPWKGNESKQGRMPRLVEQEYEQDSGKERGHEQEQGPEHELDQEHDKGDDEKEKVKKREKVKEKENEGEKEKEWYGTERSMPGVDSSQANGV